MFWIMMLSALFLSPPSPAPQEADCINGLNPTGSCIFRLPFGLSNRKSRVDVRWGMRPGYSFPGFLVVRGSGDRCDPQQQPQLFSRLPALQDALLPASSNLS